MDEATLDDIISRLLDVRNGRQGKQVQLTEAEIRNLCMASRDIFLQQPNLLELEAPIKICGEGLSKKSMDLIMVAYFRVIECKCSYVPVDDRCSKPRFAP